MPFPATVFAAGQAEFIAENRQKRWVRRAVDEVLLAVNFEFDRFRHSPSLLLNKALPPSTGPRVEEVDHWKPRDPTRFMRIEIVARVEVAALSRSALE